MQNEFSVRRKMLRQVLEQAKQRYLDESQRVDRPESTTGCPKLDGYFNELLKAAQGRTFPGHNGNSPADEERAYEPAVEGFEFLRWEYVGQIREHPVFQLDPNDSTIVREWLLEQTREFDWTLTDNPGRRPAQDHESPSETSDPDDPPLGLKHQFQSPPAGLEK